MKSMCIIFFVLMCVSCASTDNANQDNSSLDITSPKLRALIIDGQNNHDVWPKSSVMMKQYLEESGLFEVTIYRTKPTWKGDRQQRYYALYSNVSSYHADAPLEDESFAPPFSEYDVIISNFGHKTAPWPKPTQAAFEDYMKKGGGFVSIHAANNAFPRWKAFNEMIGVGGWGARDEKAGPYLYYDQNNVLVTEFKKGRAGTHGQQHELVLTKRTEHPILQGLPEVWKHTKDECYGRLRGPAKNLIVLATALCLKTKKGTGKHEPALMTVSYGKGRIFHSTLGHNDYSFESVGFITTFLRGAEWAASGKVTQAVPADFPTKQKSTKRKFKLAKRLSEALL